MKPIIPSIDFSLNPSDSAAYKAGYKRGPNIPSQPLISFVCLSLTSTRPHPRFRSKYHPEEFEKRKTEQSASLKRRLNVFLELLNTNWIDSVSIDVEKATQIVRLLDAAVIKLEGGTDFDLKSLDECTEEEKSTEPDLSLFAVEVEKPVKTEAVKRESEAGEESDEDPNKGMDRSQSFKGDEDSEQKTETTQERPETINQDSVGSIEDGEASMDASSDSKVTLDQKHQSTPQEIKNETNVSPEKTVVSVNTSDSEKPRPLHKTVSIFIRNIAPSITKQEIEEVTIFDDWKGPSPSHTNIALHSSTNFSNVNLVILDPIPSLVVPTLPRLFTFAYRGPDQ